MRLLDKAISQGHDHFKKALGLAMQDETFTCVIADEVYRHIAESEKQGFGPSDFPYFIPPWSSSFVEWNDHRRINMGGGFVETNTSHQTGCIVHDTPRKGSPVAMHFPAEYPDATRCVILVPLRFEEGALIDFPNSCVTVYTNDDGLVLGQAIAGEAVKYANNDDFQDIISHLIQVIGMTFTFANCKNVTLDDRTEEYQPSNKILRRLKLPSIKRYTLNISGSSTNRCEGGSQKEFGVMPFHLCRGHFASYTAEKPLFGRLVGKFWIPAHMRGKKDRGEIIKDYSVSPEM